MSSSDSFRVGLVQMCSGNDVDRNVNDAVALIRDAADRGAQYIQTPEVTTLMELDRDRLFGLVEPESTSRALATFLDVAKELKIWLHIGSMAVRENETHLANRSYVIAPDGEIRARYDKIHMFDVDLPSGESYRESTSYRPGEKAIVTELPWGGLGLTICYDLRFPSLHRTLAQHGAQFIASPAAFTKTTGEAHWHTLIKARAIESQCFVFAAAQGGRHDNNRETFGHSLVISPWGEVLAEGKIYPSVIISDVKWSEVGEVRARVPSLSHDRAFQFVP